MDFNIYFISNDKKKHFSLPTFDGIYVYHLRFISFSEFVFFFVLSVHFKIYDENNKNGIYKNNFAIDIGLVKQLIWNCGKICWIMNNVVATLNIKRMDAKRKWHDTTMDKSEFLSIILLPIQFIAMRPMSL